MRLTLGPRLLLHGAPPGVEADVQNALTLPNPEWALAKRQGRWTGHIPPELPYWRRRDGGLELPRGTAGLVRHFAREHRVEVEIVDRTLRLPDVNLEFTGTLRDYQTEALERVTRWPNAVLSAPTGSGKTVVGLAAIARRKQPALVLVHTATLMDQWVDRAETFLGLSRVEIGRVGGGKLELGSRLTIGVVNSVSAHAAKLAQHIGHLVVDECHRAPGLRYAKTIGAFPARYVLGLSATPWRSDGLTPVVSWLLGRVHKIARQPLIDAGAILPADVFWVRTNFTATVDPQTEYSEALRELTEDPERTALVAHHAGKLTETLPGIVLVLSDRRDYCESICEALRFRGVSCVSVTGELTRNARVESLALAKSGAVQVMVATAQLIGEGFDLPEISAAVLATPARFDGRVLQLVGRALRPAPGKTRAVVLDFLDENEPVFAASARARSQTYERQV